MMSMIFFCSVGSASSLVFDSGCFCVSVGSFKSIRLVWLSVSISLFIVECVLVVGCFIRVEYLIRWFWFSLYCTAVIVQKGPREWRMCLDTTNLVCGCEKWDKNNTNHQILLRERDCIANECTRKSVCVCACVSYFFSSYNLKVETHTSTCTYTQSLAESHSNDINIWATYTIMQNERRKTLFPVFSVCLESVNRVYATHNTRVKAAL